jgi:hypothetical protein
MEWLGEWGGAREVVGGELPDGRGACRLPSVKLVLGRGLGLERRAEEKPRLVAVVRLPEVDESVASQKRDTHRKRPTDLAGR